MRTLALTIALLTLLAAPAAAAPLTAAKSSTLVSDPVDGIVVPKRIPGALIDYNILVGNPNTIVTTVGAVAVADHIPTGTQLFVGNLGAAGSGPVAFTDGVVLGLLGSNLTYTYTSLASTSDSLEFSNNNGASFAYTPAADANGFDAAVTDVRVKPSGTFAPGSSFNLRFRVAVR